MTIPTEEDTRRANARALRLLRLGPGYIKRIHVDQSKIRNHDPDPITIQTSAGPLKASGVAILGESKVIYSPDYRLSCGARLWIETTAQVDIEEA